MKGGTEGELNVRLLSYKLKNRLQLTSKCCDSYPSPAMAHGGYEAPLTGVWIKSFHLTQPLTCGSSISDNTHIT